MPLALRLALRPRPRPLPALSLTVLSLASCEARPSRPGVAWVRRASSSSSSSSRWKQRQGRDKYARDAKVHGLKSRAAFKLLEMDAKYHLFKPNQTVVDLGYAPGSWSQVAVERTRPRGRVVGIDLIPAQPPRGVATFQGDFLSPMVQRLVKDFILRSAGPGTPPDDSPAPSASRDGEQQRRLAAAMDQPSYIDRERHLGEAAPDVAVEEEAEASSPAREALVDLVLSDMSAPWDQTSGFNSNTLSNPHHRLMNTSGHGFRDHAGSMGPGHAERSEASASTLTTQDLCAAALQFASDTLRPGGHFVCKFYQGAEDKALERRLKMLFAKVHREKPESSRSESKEAYFIALRRKQGVILVDDA